MKTQFGTRSLVLLGMLTAITMLFSLTPIGSIPVGPLVITLNVIPVAIAAIALGPVGGLIMGSIFGLMSFLQCFGIGVLSSMGAILVQINPFLAFVQRVVPRALDGFLAGLIFRGVRKVSNTYVSCAVTGFCTAFLNTLLFMSSLVLLFGRTEYMEKLIDGRSVIVYICATVGINAVVEMIVCTVIAGAVGAALFKAKLISDK